MLQLVGPFGACVNQSQHNRLQSGVAGVYEPSGSDSMVTQTGQANDVAQADVVNPDGSGVGGEAREANAAGRQMDMVTNQNPMDSFVTPPLDLLNILALCKIHCLHNK
ncbi:hypothetical protein Tco_0602176 [Tanacetum coccineum]